MNQLEQILVTSLSMSSLKSDSDSTVKDIIKMVGIMGAMYFVKEARVIVPKLFDMAFSQCRKRAVQMVEEQVVMKGDDVSQIIFTRDYESSDESCEVIDALIDYLCNCKNVKSLAYTTFYTFNSRDEFDITDDITGKYVNNTLGDNGIKQVIFAIRSKTLNTRELRIWCLRVLEEYKERRQSGFLLDRYYFNETTKQGRTHFTMTKFSTNKRLCNLFGRHIDIVRNRVNMFVNNKKWYTDKGIPYSLGFILEGIPGAGKTSMIKAIANDTNRHIINLSLTKQTTVSHLRKLFFDNQIMMSDGGMIRIPISERLYVIEDADCLTDILLSRKYKEQNDDEEEKLTYEEKRAREVMSANAEPPITLSHILNILDGVLETPGRIIIMTTNHLERLDPALKRPGRFDLIIEFKPCTAECIQQMTHHFLEINLPLENLKPLDGKLTPAQVQNVLLTLLDSDEPSRVLEDLTKLTL